jgi:hypothetical protein
VLFEQLFKGADLFLALSFATTTTAAAAAAAAIASRKVQ